MSNVDKRSVEGQVPVRLCNYTDVYYGDRITPSADLMKATATPDQVKAFRLDIGDVVVTKDSEDASDIGVPAFVEESAPDLLCGYHLAVLRPLQDRTSGRYLYWAMASRRVQDHFSVNATGITRYGLRTDSISAAPIPWWPVPTQRAIADFLDEETARIDALIAKKRRLIDALSERASRLLTSHFERLGVLFPSDLDGAVDWVLPPDWRLAHLSVVLNQLTNGFVGPTRDILRDDGIPYIQSLHIKNGGIDFGRRPFYVSEEWHAERPRIHLRPGDVLVVQTGDIGQVAVVPPGFGPASCHALQILRVRPELVSGEYLGEYLRSPFGQQSLLSRATGALHPHLEGGIRNVPVVIPPRAAQSTIVAEVAASRERIVSTCGAINRQIELLVEHRQALIAAAVTGVIEVPGVAA